MLEINYISASTETTNYTSRDMIEFAKFWYGPDIDMLDNDSKFQCKEIAGALLYWTKNIKRG